MIKNGGNGSFRVVFPLVRLVSLLRGFNSSGLCFLNLFNDPRIIREQRIAAYNGYRGGGVVQVLKGTSKGGVQAKNPDVGVYRSRLKCWICLSAAAVSAGTMNLEGVLGEAVYGGACTWVDVKWVNFEGKWVTGHVMVRVCLIRLKGLKMRGKRARMIQLGLPLPMDLYRRWERRNRVRRVREGGCDGEGMGGDGVARGWEVGACCGGGAEGVRWEVERRCNVGGRWEWGWMKVVCRGGECEGEGEMGWGWGQSGARCHCAWRSGGTGVITISAGRCRLVGRASGVPGDVCKWYVRSLCDVIDGGIARGKIVGELGRHLGSVGGVRSGRPRSWECWWPGGRCGWVETG
ncbi:hypothetical protein Tco_1185320 [Tanacetum coccineum]